MHSIIIHHLTALHLFLLLLQYGYLLLFPIAVIEGPVAAIVAGALVATGALNAYVVFVLLVVADLTGDFLYYSLGRWGHVHMIEKISSRLGLSESRMTPLKAEFIKNDWKLILIGKTQGLGAIILYFAGASRMKLNRFLAWNFVGTIPKVLIFMAVGYLFGQSLLRSQRYFDYITIFTFALGLVLLIAYLFVKRYMEGNVENSFSPLSDKES
jgi:membrane protein DedA with SNARE-associated domain